MTPTRVALAALSLLVFAPAALADVPPPPGYVEQCTVAKQKKAGEECVSCGAAYFREPDACKKLYEGQGYDRRCKTRGASTWDEVWCRKKGAKKPTPAPTPTPAPSEEPTPAPSEAPAAPSEAPPSDEATKTPDAPLPGEGPTLTRPVVGDPPPTPTPPEAATDAPPTPPPATDAPPTPTPPTPSATPPAAPEPPAVRDLPPPEEKKKSSCAGGPVTTSAGLLFAALVLVLRRRARRA